MELFFNIRAPALYIISNFLEKYINYIGIYKEDENQLKIYLYFILDEHRENINLLMPFFNSLEYTPDPKYLNINNTCLNIYDLIEDLMVHCKNKDYFYFLDEENNYYPYNYEEDMKKNLEDLENYFKNSSNIKIELIN